VVGVLAGLASFWIAEREANEFRDLQLRQVAQLVGSASRWRANYRRTMARTASS
jgi:hypothetical protein